MSMKLHEMPAAELSALMEKREISAVEVCRSTIARADAAEKIVGAYITRTDERALAAAERIDARRAAGEPLHPLAGIPIAYKDNICVEGARTTCASKMLENFTPPYTATVAERLEAAGTVMTGKLNLDEFAMGATCRTSKLGRTANPHDVRRVAGGSSGGSAAAVAAGEVPLALGTDTGGSIRCPASFCGVVGMKPTYGSVSRYGIVPFASSLDQAGPMARTVEDVAMLFDAMRGRDPRDATSRDAPYPALELSRSVSGLRIALPSEYFGAGISSEVGRAVMSAAGVFETLGAKISEVSMSALPYALSAYYVISSAEGSSNLARFDGIRYGYRAENAPDVDELYLRSRSEGFGDEVKRRIMIGTYVLSAGAYDAYYGKAREVARTVRGQFDEVWGNFDIILTPVTPHTAPRIDEKRSVAESYAADMCTVGVNIAGLPAISVPCALGEGGMPIGLQLIGPRWSERQLLGAALTYEKTTGLSGRVAVIPGVDI